MNTPARLGKYPITGVLGKGAMGAVYRAYDPVIKRPVAIKTIRKELIDEDVRAESLANRFRKEAQAAGALNHPGIVAIYEYGEDDEYAYIAMECVEGNTLRDYLARGATFDERDTISIMSQLLDALAFAHSHSIWHRDIKPANIMVMANGRIKLADFGVARIESSDRTQASVIMGTPGYIAPEQYLGEACDWRMDIFSAGVLFYVLLAGQAPFRGRPEAIMHDVCYVDPEPPSAVDPLHRWPKYDAIVLRALQKKPGDRFQSATEFRSAILAAFARPVSEAISESTIIATRVRPPTLGSSPPAAPRTTQSAGTSLPPPTGWDATVLGKIEIELARYIGPVAKVLVRRAAREHGDQQALVATVAQAIERNEDRERFFVATIGIRSVARVAVALGGATDPTHASAPTAGPALTAQDLERATQLLTTYIGPIARVVARRAATEGVSRREFFTRVAQSLDTEVQRERFLREAGALIG